MAMICLSAESWKSWEKSGKAEFLRTCKTFVRTQTLVVENTETKDLKRALYELCWCGINGHLKPEQIVSTLGDIADMHPQVPSLVADLFSAIDVELMVTEDAESRERFVSVVTACQHLVTDNLLKERLDADTLENMGLVQSKTAFQQKYVKTKTKLYYKQQKFNLLREESEGYAKLITELNQDVSHDVVLQNIKSLIGCFNLDPNRVLDIILESFECNPNQTDLFVPLLREYAVDKETLCHVLGFKFHFYQQTEDSVTPASLYHVAALLLHHGLVDFSILYSHLSPPNADIVDRCKKEMMAAKQYQRKAMVVNLGDKAAQNDAKEAEKEKEEKIEPIANNQKFGLCEALIRIGAWEQAKSVMAAVPPFSVVSHKPVAQCLCQLINYVIEPLYVEHSGIPKLILGKRPPVVKFELVPQTASFAELPTMVFPMLRQLGPHLAADVTLVVKLNRLARNFMEKKATLSLDETQYAEVFAGFLTIYDEAILPSLSLMPNNCCMSEEIWGFVKLLKYEHRYRLYGQWKNESRLGHPRLIRVHTDILDRAKYIMKRLAKENVKPLGRQLGKLSHSAPGIVFEYILSQIQKYDNFIGPVVDSLKFLTNMSYDVLLYCVIEALANPERERLKTDDTNISFWLQCLANFSGSVLKKYQVDIAGLLQYIANQLKAQKSYDLAILRDVVQKMAGIEVTEEMTDDQLSAMGGGELLRQEGGYFTQVRNTRKSSSRLMECLLEHDLAIPMCLLMAQQRQAIVFRHTLTATATQQIEDKRHIKLIGKLYDQCQDTLVQFINFMSLQLTADEIVARLPNIHELLTTYHIPPEVAFALWRIVFSSQIASKFEEMRKADKKDKTIANSQTQKATRYAEAIENTMNPVCLLVSPVYPPKVWEEISMSFYTTFWSLAMYDLQVPTTAYEKQIQIHKAQMALEEDSAAGKKKKEKERFTVLLDKLTEEEKRQQEHVKLVMARLRAEKETWFPSKTAKHSAITTVLQLCMFPRCCLTAIDAIFCAKFLYIMHNLKTPNFSSLICYDRIFTDITWALTSCTENEAHRYGRFLCGLLDDVMRWHADKSDFEKECLNYPGFVTVFRAPGSFTNFADQLDYENYRHVVHKWHYSLTRVSVNCLESGDYCQIRNMLIVLTKILPHYPRVSKLGQALERRVDRVIDEEKEKRQDLYVFALAYSGQLKSTKKTWQQDHEFHRKEPAEGKPQAKPPTPTSTAPNAASAPAAVATGTGNVTIKREPTSNSSEKRDRQPVSSSSHDVKPSVAEKNPATSSSSSSTTKPQGREADTTRRSDDRMTSEPTYVLKLKVTAPDARDPSKESREAGNSSKLKGKHKLSSSDLKTDGERVSKERRHESAGREKRLDRSGGGANPQQPAADLPPEVDTRRGEEKRSDSRTEKIVNRDADDRMKERSSTGHRIESDTESLERGRSSADFEQGDEGAGSRSADGHRRSVETNVSSSSGKASDEREVKRRKVEVTSGSKESLGCIEPLDRMHKTQSLASDRERGDRVGSSSSGRTAVKDTDMERERKLQARAEKLERKRVNDALLCQAQTIPLNRAADDLERNKMSDSATPPNIRDKSGKLNGSEPARGHRDGQRSHSREGDGSSRSRDSEPERVVQKKVDKVTPTTSLRALQRDHIRSKDPPVSDDPQSSKERMWNTKEDDNSPRERLRKEEAAIRERHRPREEDIGLKDTVDDKDKRSSEKRLRKSKRH